MKFISTRGQSEPLSFTEAVAKGLAPDGGLYLPEALPDLSSHLEGWKDLGYADLCYEFMQHFATDMPSDVLRKAVDHAYKGFTDPEIAPVKQLHDGLYVCELFHGPTLAFKGFRTAAPWAFFCISN